MARWATLVRNRQAYLSAVVCAAAVVGGVSPALAAEPAKQLAVEPPTPNSPDEPIAKEFSFAKAAEFLDRASRHWTAERKCGTCHTNYAYLMARPSLSETSAPAPEIRAFFENRAANWETAKPRWPAEVVATASALAFNDSVTSGRLHPMTRKALDWMWTLQREDG